MQEPTDNQLDGLFRKSAEEFDVPYDPAAWLALKNRLDDYDRLTVWEHVLRWGLPVLLLVVLTAGSWNANRKQVRPSQARGSEVATGQYASKEKVLLPNGTAQDRQPRVDSSPLRLNGAIEPDLSRSGSLKKGAVAQPGGANERSVKASRADETATNVDKSVVLSTTNRRGLLTASGVTDRSSNSGKSTTIAGRSYPSNPAVRPSTTMDPVSGVSVGRAKTNKSAATVERTGRARSGSVSQRQSGRWSRNGDKNRLAATLSATDHIMKPERSFTKRRETLNATGESLAKKSGNGSKKLPDALVGEHSVATTTPVSAQVTTENGMQPAQPASFVELTSRPGQWPEPLSFIGKDVTAPATPTAPEMAAVKQSLSTQRAYIQKGMSIRFVVSPDLSGIGLKDFSRPGTNVGLLLEYRMTSRWSVQAGVLQSTKVYKALITEYELPDYTAKWRVLPQSVNGRCRMLDIPLNLRYDLALRPRSNGLPPGRWFVSGGVTTYIMQKEDYDYVYAEADRKHVYPNAYPSMTGWHGKTGGYGFSQLNLSMGYEQAFSRRLSWQVEPFVKVPLKGVGYYNIELLSTGAFFSVRYKF